MGFHELPNQFTNEQAGLYFLSPRREHANHSEGIDDKSSEPEPEAQKAGDRWLGKSKQTFPKETSSELLGVPTHVFLA